MRVPSYRRHSSGQARVTINGKDHLLGHTAVPKQRANDLFGPKAKAILAPNLLRAADTHCFSPKESEAQRLEARNAARKTPLSCGNKRGSNVARKLERARRVLHHRQLRSSTPAYAAICKSGRRINFDIPLHRDPSTVRPRSSAGHSRPRCGRCNSSRAERDRTKAVKVIRRIG